MTDNTIYSIKVKTLSGKEISLNEYAGKLILVVNIATKCGQVPQLKELEKLFTRYKDKGFIILAFPSDQFHQEPLAGAAIETYCAANFGVTFPIFEKTILKGADANALFKFFADKNLNGKIKSKPHWNYYKYLIGRDGKVIDYYWLYTKPLSKKLIKAIESAL